ncbi:MAG: hypothetical protein Q7S28_04300 [bacterium]|nr:hypothetical protein [bacterium]
MAIIVEEAGRDRSSMIRYGAWGCLLILVGVAGYYIFFKSPEKVLTTATPANFEQIQALAQIQIDPSIIAQNPLFGGFLQHYVSPLAPPQPGRANPFLDFAPIPPPVPTPAPK